MKTTRFLTCVLLTMVTSFAYSQRAVSLLGGYNYKSLETEDTDIQSLKINAEAGDFYSAMLVGDYYLTWNTTEAIRYYELAVTAASLNLADILVNGYGPNLAQVSHNLGCLYSDLNDVEKAMAYWAVGAEWNHPSSSYMLGYYLINSDGVYQNKLLGLMYVEQGAELGSTDAQLYLADGYMYGTVVGQDMEEAMKWYGQAAEAGNAKGQYMQGWYAYYYQYDISNAMAWLKLAGKNNHADACMLLSKIYEEDLFDPQSALYWLVQASKNGNREAKDKLDKMGISVKQQNLYDTTSDVNDIEEIKIM